MSRRQDHAGDPGAMHRLAAPPCMELLDSTVLDSLLVSLSAMLAMEPAKRPFISLYDLIKALAQALALHLMAPEQVTGILAFYDNIQRENSVARCNAWTPGPPLPPGAKTRDGGLPIWPGGVG